MPHLNQEDAQKLLENQHAEWAEMQATWRWLLDSHEGGERYRNADYFRGPFVEPTTAWFGWDVATGQPNSITYNMISKRNLIPHTSEMDPRNRDIYALRLARTPVPKLVSRVTRRYLSRIYSRQVKRDEAAPAAVQAWWDDVDGAGTEIGEWMTDTVGPLLLTLGQIDLVFAHPEAPEGAVIETQADLERLGLGGVVADFILPENLVWWRLDARRRYTECLVFERSEDGDAWRHWTATDSNCYSADGIWDAGESYPHAFGRPPIVRVFDERKLRLKNTGQSRMESTAELQKSIYNRRSELILSDVQQCHAQLQGPEEYMQNDGMIQTGPNGALPMKKTGDTYTAWAFLDPPKSGAIECREHIKDDEDEVLADAALLKAAGMVRGSTVAQSGISKVADQSEGNDVVAKVAGMLGEAEEAAACMALLVASDGRVTPADEDAIEVEYPAEFALFTAEDLSSALSDIQQIAAVLGYLPLVEGEVLKRLITVLLPGIDEETLAALHAEVDTAVKQGAARAAATGSTSRIDPNKAMAVGAKAKAETNGSTYSASGSPGSQDPTVALPRDAAARIQQSVANFPVQVL